MVFYSHIQTATHDMHFFFYLITTVELAELYLLTNSGIKAGEKQCRTGKNMERFNMKLCSLLVWNQTCAFLAVCGLSIYLSIYLSIGWSVYLSV